MINNDFRNVNQIKEKVYIYIYIYINQSITRQLFMKNLWECLDEKYCEANIFEFLNLEKEEVKEIIYNNGKIALFRK